MRTKKLNSKLTPSNIFLHILLIILSAACILPLLLVLIISFTDPQSIKELGYSFFPSAFSLDAYEYIFIAKDTVFNAYWITIQTTVIGTALSVLVISLFAYPLSRKDFKYRQIFTFFAFFTMLFNGGIVSWYMICKLYLRLGDTLAAMILPYTVNVWYVVIMRTFFATTIPDAIIESAKIDGAGEFRTFFKLVLPLSLPGLATIGLFTVLTYWNDWWLPLMFIENPKMFNLQILLQNMLNKIQMLTENTEFSQHAGQAFTEIPADGARMALCMIATGPIVAAYPFFQKYFIQGLTIGAIKG